MITSNNINSLYLTINKFNSLYEKKLDKLCMEYNINYSSFIILNTIDMINDPTPSAIAKINNTSRQNTSKIVIKLINLGLVEEIKNNSKNKNLSLSLKGEELLKCLKIKFDDWNDYYSKNIENNEILKLKNDINKIINLLQNDN